MKNETGKGRPVEETALFQYFSEWKKALNRGRGARPRSFLSSSGRFQGSQECGSFEGFLQGFFSAEESRGVKKCSFEAP
jgi:hypothetical protein